MRKLLQYGFAVTSLVSLAVAGPLLVSVASAGTLHDAAKKGDVAALTAALDAGDDVNEMSGGSTPLFSAASRGHLEAVKFLVAHGADVNTKSRHGTPLMAASARKSHELLVFLLTNGADPNADLDSQTALHVSAERGCLDCVRALVDAGADVNARQSKGGGFVTLVTTPIHLAIVNEHQQIADYLIAHGVILPKPAPISGKLAAADPVQGKAYFENYCRSCHTVMPGVDVKYGPNLWNVVGRDKASVNYSLYSKTLLALEGDWTLEDINVFLSGPTVTTPGTKMQVQGVPDETDRANLIAYLRTLSDSPVPLP
jgi:cytochrome c